MRERGMDDRAEAARDDLVFLKALVTEGGQAQSALQGRQHVGVVVHHEYPGWRGTARSHLHVAHLA